MSPEMIVIYKSSTGFTKRYAEMIAEEMECTAVDFRAVTVEMLSGYDLAVFGSRAHAGRIDGFRRAEKLLQKSGVDRMVLFVTGATPQTAVELTDAFWKQNLTEDELRSLPHFYMQSALCYEKMSPADRMMMKAALAVTKRKKEKTAFDREFERAAACSYDFSSRKYISPLISFLRSL